MADLMDMRWLVRDMNNRAADEVRIQHIFTPGLPEEIKTEKLRRRKFAKAEMHIPFYFLLDILYMCASFLSVAVSLIYFMMFPTLLGWNPSIQSFTEDKNTLIGDNELSHDMLESNGYRVDTWCSYYLFISIILFINSWTSFIGAGFFGKRTIHIISIVTHGLILLTEAFAVYNAFVYLPPTCDTTLLRTHMKEFFKWYGILSPHPQNRGHEAMDKIHEVQAALGCCGVDGYKDYEKIFATKGDVAFDPSWYPEDIHVPDSYSIKDFKYYTENGREVRRMPHSCCNPFWRLNVYCADDIFTMERNGSQNIARSRLNRRGCVEAVEETCEELMYLLTYGMLAVLILRLFLWCVMVVVTAITLRSMALIMTTLFSVTRGNVRFIYDYRKTRPEEDPYKRAIADFRRGIEPEGWDEFVTNRIEGRKKAHLIAEEFASGDLMSHADVADKEYFDMIQKWKSDENGPVYFGVEPPPKMTEEEYLTLRGQEKVRRQSNSVFSRLAKIGVDDRRVDEERKVTELRKAAVIRMRKTWRLRKEIGAQKDKEAEKVDTKNISEVGDEARQARRRKSKDISIHQKSPSTSQKSIRSNLSAKTKGSTLKVNELAKKRKQTQLFQRKEKSTVVEVEEEEMTEAPEVPGREIVTDQLPPPRPSKTPRKKSKGRRVSTEPKPPTPELRRKVEAEIEQRFLEKENPKMNNKKEPPKQPLPKSPVLISARTEEKAEPMRAKKLPVKSNETKSKQPPLPPPAEKIKPASAPPAEVKPLPTAALRKRKLVEREIPNVEASVSSPKKQIGEKRKLVSPRKIAPFEQPSGGKSVERGDGRKETGEKEEEVSASPRPKKKKTESKSTKSISAVENSGGDELPVKAKKKKTNQDGQSVKKTKRKSK